MLKPYPYQRKCLDALRLTRNSGRKRALVVMATGLGKTVVSAFEIKALLKQAPGRVLYLCHNNDILRQARKTFEKVLGDSYTYGYFHGTEKHVHEVDVLFASFQTMDKWRTHFKEDEFRYIVVDEVHHAHAATFRPTIEYFEPNWMVGLTATPERSDGLDIATLFEGPPVFELGIFKALARRYLCDVDYRIMTDEIQKLDVLDTPVGKLSIAELNRTVFVPKRDEEIARIIQQKAAEEFENPRVMIFCASIEHAERMAKLMPHVAVVHSKLKPKEKDQRLDAFRSGEINTILTVDMLNEGIDVPEANVIVFLRSTASRRIFLQQLGRGLRKALGKLKVLVLDFVANCERLEMIDQLQQGVREALNSLPTGPKLDGETKVAQSAFTLTVDGGEFDERVWKIFDVIRDVHEGYTTVTLKAQMQAKAIALGKAPTTTDVNNDPSMASSITFYRAFGWRWNEDVLSACGIEGITRTYTDSQLIEQLRAAAKELGRTPTGLQLSKMSGYPAPQTFAQRFGSYPAAVKVAELESHGYGESRAEIIEQLQALAKRLGRTPKKTDVEEASKRGEMAGTQQIRNKFGGLALAVEAAGMKPTQKRGWSDDDLLDQLLALWTKLGRRPNTQDVMDMASRGECVSVKTFVHRFKGLGNALQQAEQKKK